VTGIVGEHGGRVWRVEGTVMGQKEVSQEPKVDLDKITGIS
jgi:hypothetical protein